MSGALEDLLAAGLEPEPFVRRALGVLESDFRELALVALGDWQRAAIPSTELFQATASLQRPSWGSWNGLLLALKQARKESLRAASPEVRARLEQATLLARALALLDETLPPGSAKELEPLGEIVRSKVGPKLKMGALLALPISLRNRVAHDSPTDETWWRDAASALRPLVAFHATREPCKIAREPAAWREPWFLDVEGERWAFNGLGHDDAALYVSRSGVARAAPERSQAVLLAFQELLGKTEARERDVKRLLAKLAPEEIKGVVLGDWLLGEPAGRGGFATVHKGRQLSTGRKVALKVLHDGLPEDARMRFQQEAAFLSRFDHPNVVRVLGHGEETWTPPRLPILSGEEWWKEFSRSAPSKTFLALEWIEGETLEEVIKRERAAAPSRAVLAGWFQQAASALAAVHGAGLIHRDVKPSNLMVTLDGTIKLMDFGIARSQGENRTLATETGTTVGTPAYMSPEQIRAADAESGVGVATDVYSLCATFYEVFTGRRLFDHDKESPKTVETKKLEGARPERPSTFAPGLGWELDTILQGGLEPEVSDRYANAVALERDVARFLNDEPIEYRRPSLVRRLKLGYRRNRTVVNLVAAFLALAVSGTTLYVRSLVEKERRALDAEATARKERDVALVAAFDANARLVEADLAKLWALRGDPERTGESALLAESARVFSAARTALAEAPPLEALTPEQRARADRAARILADAKRSSRTVAELALGPGEPSFSLGRAESWQCVALSPGGEMIAAGGDDGLLVIFDRASGRVEHVLAGHTERVEGLAFSADGETLASHSWDKTVRLWKRASGELVRTIALPEEALDLELAPDGRTVVLRGASEVRIFDASSGALRRTISVRDDYGVKAFAISPDGRVVALAVAEKIELHDLSSGELVTTLEGAASLVLSCGFSRDGAYVLGGTGTEGADERLRIWDRETGALRVTIDLPGAGVGCTAIEGALAVLVAPPDWRRMLSEPAGPRTLHVELRDANSGALLRRLEVPAFASASERDSVQGLGPRNFALSRKGDILAVAAGGLGTIDVAKGELVRVSRTSGVRVRACAVSPDGAEILAGTSAGELRLWDRASRVLLRTIAAHALDVRAVAFSPDGSLLLSASDDHTVKLWQRATGRLLRSFEGHGEAVGAVAFSPDGQQVATGCEDKTLRIFDTASGALVRTQGDGSSSFVACAFAPRGAELLAAVSSRVLVLERRTGALLRTLEHPTGVASFAVSVTGEVATLSRASNGDATLRFFGLASGELRRVFALPPLGPGRTQIAFSPDGSTVLLAVGRVELREAFGGRILERFAGAECCAFSPDGAELVTVGRTLEVRRRAGIRLELSRHRMAGVQEPSAFVSACAYSPDGTEILSGGVDETARLWDARTGRLIRAFEGQSGAVYSCALSPDGADVLVGTASGSLRIWSRATGELRRELPAMPKGVQSCVFSPDGREVLASSTEGAIATYDRATGALLRTFEGQGKRREGEGCFYSPDGREVVAMGKRVSFWDRASGRPLRSLEHPASDGAFSPEGDELVLVRGQHVELVDPATGRLVRTFEARRAGTFMDEVRSPVFSPDGALLATPDSGLVRLWDRASGRLLTSFARPGNETPATSLGFSPDGSELAAGYLDGLVVVFNVKLGPSRALPGFDAGAEKPRSAPLPLGLESDRTDSSVATPEALAARGLRLLLDGAPSSGRAYLRAAAEAGVATAAARLAWAFERGLGGPRDVAAAEHWREVARAKGDSDDPLAALLLAVEKKDEKLLRAAAERNEPDALLALAALHANEAPALVARACALGDPRALVLHGDSIVAIDSDAATRDYERAAALGVRR